MCPILFQKRLEYRKTADLESQDTLHSVLCRIFQNMEYIRLENHSRLLNIILKPKLGAKAKAHLRLVDYMQIENQCVQISLMLSEVILYLGGSLLISKGTISIDTLIYVILLTNILKNGIDWLIEAIDCLHNIKSSGKRIKSIDFNKHKERKNKIEAVRKILVQNVTFAYDDTENKLVYKPMCFEKDNIYVIVGKNGSGKSTFMKILMGYFSEYSGEILVDSLDFKSIDLESWYKNVGYVPQLPVLFEMSVRDNILFDNTNYDQVKYQSLLKEFQIRRD